MAVRATRLQTGSAPTAPSSSRASAYAIPYAHLSHGRAAKHCHSPEPRSRLPCAVQNPIVRDALPFSPGPPSAHRISCHPPLNVRQDGRDVEQRGLPVRLPCSLDQRARAKEGVWNFCLLFEAAPLSSGSALRRKSSCQCSRSGYAHNQCRGASKGIRPARPAGSSGCGILAPDHAGDR